MLGPIICRFFACSNEEKNKPKQQRVRALVLSLCFHPFHSSIINKGAYTERSFIGKVQGLLIYPYLVAASWCQCHEHFTPWLRISQNKLECLFQTSFLQVSLLFSRQARSLPLERGTTMPFQLGKWDKFHFTFGFNIQSETKYLKEIDKTFVIYRLTQNWITINWIFSNLTNHKQIFWTNIRPG